MDAPDPTGTSQEVLSQSEVERLLAQVAEQEASTVVHQSAGGKSTQAKDSIQPYDFRTPVFLTATELRRLRIHHEEFIHSLAARLSIYLRLEFGLQMSQLETVPFHKFTDSLSNPTHLTLLKVEPLRGMCVLDIHPNLGLTIVDRLLGGPGQSVTQTRDLSEIEVSLLDQAIQIILHEWCTHWAGQQDLRHTVLGHETSGQFLQICEPDAIVFVLSMEARIGDCTEQIKLGLPYATIEPLVRNLSQHFLEEESSRDPGAAHAMRWNPELAEVCIPVTAEWPALQIRAGDLSRLKPGDVLPIDLESFGKVQIRLAKLPKFYGRLGTLAGHRAIEVTGVQGASD